VRDPFEQVAEKYAAATSAHFSAASQPQSKTDSEFREALASSEAAPAECGNHGGPNYLRSPGALYLE
jgi:hypothetical protein